jgi:peptidoglycan/xylan/chitin deacetylase (PgdA/CDA1 family)
MHSIGWSIRSYDTTAKNEQQLLARILKQVTGGDIILLHDSMEITAKILPHLITQLRNKGFSFARLDTLIALPAYE